MSSSPPVAIRSFGPVASGAATWRFRGQLHVTAVVKATFGLVPDSAMTIEPPEEIQAAEVHYDGDLRRSVLYASDLSPYRKKADVVLTGHAYAPAGSAVFASVVRLVVLRGHVLLEKAFQVVGDRTTGAPVKFERLPIVYERAFGGGGWDDNPVGTGVAMGSPPPNLVDPSFEKKTVCFGPIARSWPLRARLLGPASRAAVEGPLADIPSDLDFAYFQDAPEDQQIAYLSGDEWIMLEGLHPSWPVLEAQLPGARAVGKVYGLSGARERGHPIALNADHLHIDTDRKRCSVTWRASFPVASAEILPKILLVVGVEVAGQSLVWPDPLSLFEEEVDAGPAPEIQRPPAPAIPSARTPAPAPPASAPRAVVPAVSSLEGTLELSATERLDALLESKPLPFGKAQPPVSRPGGAPPVSKPGGAPPVSSSGAPSPPASKPGGVQSRPLPAPSVNSPLEGTLALTTEEAKEAVRGGPLPFAKSVPPPAPLSAPPSVPPARSAPPSVPVRAALMDSPLESTLALTTEQAKEAVAGSGALPFGRISTSASPPPVAPPFTPAPEILEARPLPPYEGAGPATPSEPPIDTSKLFHELPRKETAHTIPDRTSDAVLVLYESPADRRGPLVTFTIPWQIKPPKNSLTIAIKATFDIVPDGVAKLRAEADLPSGDVFIDDDPQKSLALASDFAVFKARADVTLTGHAHAPGRGAPMTEVRFQVGSGSKGFERRIAVFGERVWRWTGGVLAKPTDPVQFKKIPVQYENAFGGAGYDANPVGMGFISKGALPAGVHVPYLEDPAHLLTDPTVAPPPACFGPIPLAWQERWSKAGSYNERWLKERWPYLPDDADWAITQAAPRAQQLDALQGDEPFEIAGMHPTIPVVRGTLPKLRARCFAQRTAEAGGELQEVALRLDTASFDADAMKVSLVWRGLLDVSDDDAPELATLFVITEELGAQPTPLKVVRVRLIEALARARAEAPGPSAEGMQIVLDEEVRKVEESQAQQRAAGAHGSEGRAATERQAFRERLRSEGASDEEIEAVMARTPAADKAAPPPPPDADAIADRLRRAGVSEIEVSAILAAFKGQTIDAPAPARPMSAAAPPPPPNVAAMAEGLRGAGVSESEIAAVVRSAEEVSKRPADGGTAVETPRERVLRMLAAGDALDGLELAGADLSGLDLSKRSMAGANLKDANLRGAQLASADLSAAQLSGADLTDAVLDGANLELADFFGSKLSMASLRGALITRADFTNAKGDRSSFQGAKGKGSRFTGGVWTLARFDDAVIESADFSRALLDGAAFDRAILPDVRLHGAQGAKVSFDDARIPGARADGAAFPHGSFRSVAAPGSIWNKAQLDDATFLGAALRHASFFRASCRRANMSGVDLADARLDRAKLTGARLVKSNLMAASIQQADLKNADLRGANMYACNAWKTLLSGAQLDQANLTKSTLKARS